MNNSQAAVNILLAISLLFVSIALSETDEEVQQLKQEKISGWGNE